MKYQKQLERLMEVLGLSRHPTMALIIFTAVVFLLSDPALSAPTLSTSTDLTAQVRLSTGGLVLNRVTGTFDSTLAITNTSPNAIQKPFSLALYDLPVGVILVNANAVSDEGYPLINITSGSSLVPSAKITQVLKFVNRTNRPFPLSIRLIRLEQPIPSLQLLLGPDANGNGVRDDIEPVLDSRYGGSNALRNPAIQVLKYTRIGLGETGSVESAFNALLKISKAYDCMKEKAGSLEVFETEINYLRDIMMDSRERISAWILLPNTAAGQSIPTGNPNACE